MRASSLTFHEFQKVEMRVGTILEAAIFENANKPAYKLLIDLGPLGIKKTSAQLTALYSPEELVGKQVVAVVNFPPKQIADMMSECLVLGALSQQDDVVIISPERKIENGSQIA